MCRSAFALISSPLGKQSLIDQLISLNSHVTKSLNCIRSMVTLIYLFYPFPFFNFICRNCVVIWSKHTRGPFSLNKWGVSSPSSHDWTVRRKSEDKSNAVAVISLVQPVGRVKTILTTLSLVTDTSTESISASFSAQAKTLTALVQ